LGFDCIPIGRTRTSEQLARRQEIVIDVVEDDELGGKPTFRLRPWNDPDAEGLLTSNADWVMKLQHAGARNTPAAKSALFELAQAKGNRSLFFVDTENEANLGKAIPMLPQEHHLFASGLKVITHPIWESGFFTQTENQTITFTMPSDAFHAGRPTVFRSEDPIAGRPNASSIPLKAEWKTLEDGSVLFTLKERAEHRLLGSRTYRVDWADGTFDQVRALAW
jgi:hypothetical protein